MQRISGVIGLNRLSARGVQDVLMGASGGSIWASMKAWTGEFACGETKAALNGAHFTGEAWALRGEIPYRPPVGPAGLRQLCRG